MEIHSDNPEHGFQFPGMFELSAMGPAQAGLEQALPQLLRDAGIEVLDGALMARQSSNGRYVSVRIGFLAASREQYERAHQVLRQHPDVKWTL
jgi:putative lipoic acid-binding regulatory protein